MTDRSSPPVASPGFTLLVSLSMVLVFVVVVLSAYIRLGDAGLGCANTQTATASWPACFGQIGTHDNRSLAEGGPLLPPSVARTFHRVAATIFGFFALGIVYLAFKHRRRGGPGVTLPLLVLAITVFLSVLGIATPSPLTPAVTVGNVLGGMILLALLWIIGQRLQPPTPENRDSTSPLRLGVRLGLVLVVLQIALGAWTSGSFAGPSCPQLSGCDAVWSAENLKRGFNPARRLERDAQGKVLTDASQPLVHMTHRGFALVTLLYLGWLALRARAAGGRLHTNGNALLVLLLLEIGLGLVGVATDLPLGLATAHNAAAALLLLAVVNLHFLLVARNPT